MSQTTPGPIGPATSAKRGTMSAAHFTKLDELMSAAAQDARFAALEATSHTAVTVSSPTGWLSIASQALTFALVAASDVVAGVVSIGAQTFAGIKTFASAVVLSAGLTINGVADQVVKVSPPATSGTGFAAPTMWFELTGTNQTRLIQFGSGLTGSTWEFSLGYYTGGGAPIMSTRSQGLYFDAPSGGWLVPVSPNVVDLGTASNAWRTVRTNQVWAFASSATHVPIYGRGAPAQADSFLRIDNSGNTPLLTLDPVGDLNVFFGNVRVGYHLQLNTASNARPTANAANRGTLYYSKAAGGVADVVQVCLKSAGDTYSWVTIATG